MRSFGQHLPTCLRVGQGALTHTQRCVKGTTAGNDTSHISHLSDIWPSSHTSCPFCRSLFTSPQVCFFSFNLRLAVEKMKIFFRHFNAFCVLNGSCGWLLVLLTFAQPLPQWPSPPSPRKAGVECHIWSGRVIATPPDLGLHLFSIHQQMAGGSHVFPFIVIAGFFFWQIQHDTVRSSLGGQRSLSHLLL